MQNLVNSVYSKRFLVIYLALIAMLLLFFLPDKSNNIESQQIILTESGLLSPPLALPQFLLRTVSGAVFTNADLLGRWNVVYLYDGRCAPACNAIWYVLNSLALANASDTLSILVVDMSNEEPDFSSVQFASSVQILSATTSQNNTQFKVFLTGHIETPQTYVFLIDPEGRWYAQFKAPFTSSSLQSKYLAYRAAYARSE